MSANASKALSRSCRKAHRGHSSDATPGQTVARAGRCAQRRDAAIRHRRTAEELEARYADDNGILAHLTAIREAILAHVNSFIEDEPDIPPEAVFSRCHLNLIVDNRGTDGAPVIYLDRPATSTWWGASSITCTTAPCSPTSR
ncbi:hypothetical protein DSL92_05435 [Billgrantia gudaonensis]|uniref:Uncharacterized protein n=1 Tax=Billgrantia gudaonensis TaxID=376427 RepID=A0A3S0QFZ4_9GAMM|nr:hypothetical protein DSL92_05435 [Halomonas gudaonensis]